MIAECYLWISLIFGDFEIHPVRSGKEQADNPDDQAGEVNHHGIFTREHLDATDDGQVRFETDEGQHEDAAVQMNLLREDFWERLVTTTVI